jgi:hypothetical protein
LHLLRSRLDELLGRIASVIVEPARARGVAAEPRRQAIERMERADEVVAEDEPDADLATLLGRL